MAAREGGRRSVGSLGSGSNGDIGSQGEFGLRGSVDDGKPQKFTTLVRVITVIAYIISVSTAAALLSAYYIFLWEPHPSDPLNRPTEPPYSLAQSGQHGSSHFSGGSYYHYPKGSDYSHSRNSPPERSKKSRYKTTPFPPNFLPKPQYLSRNLRRPPPTPPAA